jgi:hypothetical protein
MIMTMDTSKSKSQWTSSTRDQTVNILSFMDHLVSIETTQLCHYREKTAIDNMQSNPNGCVPIKLYL